MSNQLNQYAISLSIKGIHRSHNPHALERITDELQMRSHLKFNSIAQKHEGETQTITIELIYWGLSEDSTAKQASEELFEIACAVLDHPEGISVHIEG